jgi:hypothetical protein
MDAATLRSFGGLLWELAAYRVTNKFMTNLENYS